MANIQKLEMYFMKKRYNTHVKYTARGGYFYIPLPAEAHNIVGDKVTGDSVEGVIQKFKEANTVCIKAAVKEEKVIIYECEITCDIKRKNFKMYKRRWSQDEGTGFNIRCEVFKKKSWIYGDNQSTSEFESLKSSIPFGACFDTDRNIMKGEDLEDEDDRGRRRIEIPWTQAREDFFRQLVISLENMIIKISKLSKEKKDFISLVDSKAKLLPGVTTKKEQQ